MVEINLNEFFRKEGHSKARKVAELLLSGRPYTRQDLADEAGNVSVTTVNRVVDILEEAGATVLREQDGKQAVFRVVEINEPRRRTQPPGLDEEGMIVKDEYIGGAHVVDFVTGQQRFRGRYPGLSKLPPVSTSVLVTGIEKDGDDVTVLLEPAQGRRFKLEFLQNVSQ